MICSDLSSMFPWEVQLQLMGAGQIATMVMGRTGKYMANPGNVHKAHIVCTECLSKQWVMDREKTNYTADMGGREGERGGERERLMCYAQSVLLQWQLDNRYGSAAHSLLNTIRD